MRKILPLILGMLLLTATACTPSNTTDANSSVGNGGSSSESK